MRIVQFQAIWLSDQITQQSLTDLSERELHLMYSLYQFSEQISNSSSESDELAKQQHEYLADKLGISREMVKAIMVRLRRT